MPFVRTRSALALLLTQALACQPVPTTAGSAKGASTPTSPFRASASGGQGLVFPPPFAAERRRALPRAMAAQQDSGETVTEVEWPQLDSDGHFAISGQTLRLHFNREIDTEAANPIPLTLSPPVDGKLSWSSPWVLAFHASAPFDPDTEYTVSLGELNDTRGERAAEGWQGVFTAEPRVAVAGKIISYLPEAGKPRTVAVRPDQPHRVARDVAPRILFDQPVTLAQVAKRIHAEIEGREVPVVLAHAEHDVFQQVKVDRHHVVVARPETRPAPGEQLVLTVLDESGGVEQEHEYEVAEPLTFTDVECSSYYYDEDQCTWTAGTLQLSGTRFSVNLNNTINAGEKALAKLVKVSPRVENLRIHADTWSSEGTVWISGDFRPSTTYTVKVGRLRDRYGGRLTKPLRFSVKVDPLSASVSMPEGQQVLDKQGSRHFTITTRNVAEARLELWEVEPDAGSWAEARRHLGGREKPTKTPDLVLPVKPAAARDTSVETTLDLLDTLSPGATYLARLELGTTAFSAAPPSYPSWSMAARSPTALLTPHDEHALAVHVHSGSSQTLVHVATLTDGTPVSGARVLIDGERVSGVKTGADGLAVIPHALDQTRPGAGHVIEVQSDHARAVLAMRKGVMDEDDLAPELAGGRDPLGDFRALLLSDRGVYRPGAQVELKGIVQFRQDGTLRKAAGIPVGIRIRTPTGTEVFSQDMLTGVHGSVVASFAVPSDAEIGRYQVELVAPLRDDAELAHHGIQVAEFEPPRFTVDVEAQAAADGASLQAVVHGRYLFGASMEDAPVSWTLRRSPTAFASGPLTAGGFEFRRVRGWWDDDDDESSSWMRTGEGQLDAQGHLTVSPTVEMAADQGPQRFMLEAEVTDESHRAIAGRASVVLHPAARYAGLKLGERWLGVDAPIPVEAGVIDQDGRTIAGVPVELRLERLHWKRIRRPGPGGYADEQWRQVTEDEDRCTTDGTGTAGCRLVPKHSGSYRVSAWIDGRRGGSVRAWAWGRGEGSATPSPGRRIEIVADRDSYRPGETALLSVRNPFPEATAILTIEQGGILHHETRRVTESAARFSVPLGPQHAPHAYATVTLLPRGARDEARVDWKMGALRLPVTLGDNRLDVVVASDRDRYAPGEAVDIVVDVSRNGTAVQGAEVALAVVDEGVLRLTNFHAPDPVPALYPGQGLRLWVDDSRRLLAEQLRRSHIAGDGTGSGSHSLVSTRKNFVRTALWKPQLVTDADGRTHARFTLPDNLTRFRMMAVVVDDEGRGGVHEDDFEVQKPLMAIPAVPRFASIGDQFEAAVIVHNNQDHPETTTVAMGSRSKEVEIAAGGRARVGFDLAPSRAEPLHLTFSVADEGGVVRDRVEATLPVHAPGVDERPVLHGAFQGRQEITVEVPADVHANNNGDDYVTVTVGENLWPELGARLEYLIDYPHGCVEQTTSSTLPLLAARDILPRLGVTRFTDTQLRDMIGAGVQRLATMRTSEGGLAYWPGGDEPNPFGTAYATQAVARAQRLGIAIPEGMVEGMQRYMVRLLERDQLPGGYGEEVRASLALALAEFGALPPERADALWDTVPKQGVFGTATLALALASLPGQEDRVTQLVDALEQSFDTEGNLKEERGDDYWYYGSDRRSIAQAAIALHRHRPASTVLPLLVGRLVRETGGYTTQGTAYALLALAERIQGESRSSARQRASLDGVELMPDLGAALALGSSARRYRIPLSQLRDKRVTLVLESESERAQAFMVSARWHRSTTDAQGRAETTTETGPDIYRVITDVKGRPVDFDAIEPGQVLRVVLLARMPESLAYSRRGYLAVTDHLPAGFEAMQPDLWTVAEVPEIDEVHPLYQQLRWTGSSASHVELRDDRAHFYFDRVWGEWVHATYLMRATTPGEFIASPAMAELMYEPDSAGYSRARRFTVVP